MTQVKLNGTEYTLTQDAYYSNGSDNEYQAQATDKLGNEYMVYWTIIGDENAEESDMCDWDNPVRVELISSRDPQRDAFSALLDKKGIGSVAELARIAGLPRKTVDDLCSGRTDLDRASFGTVSAICEALGISMMDLDQIISGYKQPSGRYSVETVEVDKDGHIADSYETEYFDTAEEAQKYFDSRKAEKGYGWVLYDLAEVKGQKGVE